MLFEALEFGVCFPSLWRERDLRRSCLRTNTCGTRRPTMPTRRGNQAKEKKFFF